MAKRKTGGLINRILVGKEKSEGYARSTLPSNRWELFWDIFKGRFWKLFGINLLTILFFLPLIALLVFRLILIAGSGSVIPLTQGFGFGYGAPLSFVGVNEQTVVNVDIFVYLFMPLALIIAVVGVSGAAYVTRNMVWTEGIFVANDFWRGVKKNFTQMLCIALVYSLVFYVTQLAVNIADYAIAVGTGSVWMLVIAKIMAYILLIFYSFMTFHMITMSVTYELKFSALLKNSFLFTLGLFPQNIFFAALGLIPFIPFFLGGIFVSLGLILTLMMGFSLPLLIWTDYCQWIYDKFINDRVPGAKKNRGIYEKVKESNSETLRQYREQIAITRSSLNSRPIKPITDDELKLRELPTSFNRDDLIKLQESKDVIYEDNLKYIEEHKNDPEFLPSEEEIAAKDKEEERNRRIEAAKKELEKREKKHK